MIRTFWEVLGSLNGGAKGDRTPDLNNAIVALSQLSYGPTMRSRAVKLPISRGKTSGKSRAPNNGLDLAALSGTQVILTNRGLLINFRAYRGAP